MGQIRKVVVIAGNHKQYLRFLRDEQLNPRQVRYISREEQLVGLRDVRIIFDGDYLRSPVYGCDELRRLQCVS